MKNKRQQGFPRSGHGVLKTGTPARRWLPFSPAHMGQWVCRLFLPFIAVVCITLGWAPWGAAEIPSAVNLTREEQTWITEYADEPCLCFSIDFPPIEYRASSGEFAGMGADVIRLVEANLGMTFSKKPFDDWKEILSSLEDGSCAMAPTIVKTNDRERYIFFTLPYATVPVVIVGTRRWGTNLTLDDFKGKRVAVVSGFATEGYMRNQAKNRFHVVPMPNVIYGLRAVSFGQVDAFVENVAVAAHYIDREGIPNLQVVGDTDFSFPFSIGVSRKYPLLAKAVQKAVEAIPNYELDQVRKKWASLQAPDELSPSVLRMIRIGGWFAVLLVAGLALISFFLKRRLKEKVATLKKAQDELARSEARLRAIFDWAPYSIVINDFESGRYLEANKAFLESRGIEKDVLMGMYANELTRLNQGSTEKIRDTLAREGVVKNREAVVKRPDGGDAHCLYSSVLMEFQDSRQVLSMTVDITDKKKAEDALIKSEKRFRSLFMMAPIPLLEVSGKGNIIEVNHEFTRILGYGREDYDTIGALWDAVGPDDRDKEQVLAGWREVADRDGGREKKEPEEYTLRCKDGTLRTFMVYAGLISDSILVNLFDITDVQALERHARQAQKMEALGILAGGIAHDFNNILSAIFGFSELAKLEARDNEKIKKSLDRVLAAGLRARDLVRHIMTFSRKGDFQKQAIEIAPLLEESLKFIRASFPANIHITHQVEAADAWVTADPSQLHQVFMNLFANAAHAMKAKGGKLTVRLEMVTVCENDMVHRRGVASGVYVQLMVTDTGCGIPAEVIDRIFEPFFTTKERGQGTGMGLSTVYGILKDMESHIFVHSQVDRGTRFQLLIPRKQAGDSRCAGEKAAELIEGHGHILVVDDEPSIIDWSRDLLTRLGYTVTGALGSLKALELVKQDPGAFDLVITDMTMPGMSGLDLAREILALNKEMPVILCTGFSEGLTMEACRSAGITDMVMKPMIAGELAAVVHRVLDMGLKEGE